MFRRTTPSWKPWVLVALLLGGCPSASTVQSGPEPPLAGAAAASTETGGAVPICSLPAKSNPQWYDRAVGYEIFVRSFQDSDGDGIGDLNGLRARLDWLNDGNPGSLMSLGVDLLWLMPIFESPSYHGYDVLDYEAVERDYGTEADLRELLHAASARGVRVTADLVLNHTSDDHPWFRSSASRPDGPHGNWYVWREDNPGWGKPWAAGDDTWHRKRRGWFYGLFTSSMPDLNWREPAVAEELFRIAERWLDFGLAGFRLDAVRYLVEDGGGEGQSDTQATHAHWRALRQRLDARGGAPMMVGEAWTNSKQAGPYLGTAQTPEMHMVFDFESAAATANGLLGGSAQMLADGWCARWRAFPEHGAAGTFLTNHDMRRLGGRIGEAGSAGLRLAAALLLLGPGTPWLYYGEELGLADGDAFGDQAFRLPMPWEATSNWGFTEAAPWAELGPIPSGGSAAEQRLLPNSLWNLYRRLIQMRKKSEAFSVGNAGLYVDPSEPSVLWLARQAGEESWLIAYNLGPRPCTVSWRAMRSWQGPHLEVAEGANLNGGELNLEAYGFGALRAR